MGAMTNGSDDDCGRFGSSPLDNVESEYGYSERFGIVRVNHETLERNPDDSAVWYGQVAATNRITA